ncbi:peptidoglycan hydrolase-like protein with peptidoglycan-binding domain [Lipingzhangella halophila]|uniref:Peptidoglycan hydrolase-like protein with peptidoglycan-binding domain n=1 Tax=Lipingzhangella halophila TaxID=1783352 RepID=A0A7W7RCP6_9ACTN|nr:peptidoglycan-binding protein [Lipingzhangella halophila]MBB4929557.1 peptidoglycan hydrolase-like protein with peptidoglycan-binding domain [Lipingzhangella halophila]
MFTKRRVAALGSATTAAVAFAIGGAAFPAPALADGPETPAHVASAIEEQSWVELTEGDSGYRVIAVGYFLKESGHFGGEVGLDYTPELTEAVTGYQEDRGIDASGNVDAATWEQLSDDIGLVQQGDPRADLVTGLQSSLYDLGYDLTFDGRFGPATENAVASFQEEKEVDADGIVGPLTFRAMYGEGAQS